MLQRQYASHFTKNSRNMANKKRSSILSTLENLAYHLEELNRKKIANNKNTPNMGALKIMSFIMVSILVFIFILVMGKSDNVQPEEIPRPYSSEVKNYYKPEAVDPRDQFIANCVDETWT